MSILLWTRRKAYFFDNLGNELGNMYFDKTSKTIQFKDKVYVTPQALNKFITKKKRNGILWDTDEYFYNVDTPEPLILKKRVIPAIDTLTLATLLKTNVLKELTEISKGKLEIKMQYIVIGVIVLIALIYFMTKGG